MRSLDVWLVQTGEPLPINGNVRKMRTALMADKLLERGHSVYWWASAFEHQRKTWIAKTDGEIPVADNFTIRVIKSTGYRKNYSIQRYLDHIWLSKKFRVQCRRLKKPDVIIASLPCHHLAYECCRYARSANIPIVVDIRDPWPDIFLRPLKRRGLRKLGRTALAVDFYKLHSTLKNANSITSTSFGFLKWGLEKANKAPTISDRVFYTGYRNGLTKSAKDKCLSKEDKKTFIYVGTFGQSYELDLILDVADRLNRIGQGGIRFVLVGEGEKYERIKERATRLDNVLLTGWVEKEDIHQILQSAWAAIAPCNSVVDTIPNKVFEYMSAGLPVISSLEGEIEQSIQDYQLGINYKPGDGNALYNAVRLLADHPRTREHMSTNATRFYRHHGDADKVYARYVDHIEAIMTLTGQDYPLAN